MSPPPGKATIARMLTSSLSASPSLEISEVRVNDISTHAKDSYSANPITLDAGKLNAVFEDIVPKVSDIPGEEWDHRHRRPKAAFDQRPVTFPCSIEEFLHKHRALLHARRFTVIPETRVFSRWKSHPSTRLEAWKAHWLHRGSCFDVPSGECDVAYLRTRREQSYQIKVADIRRRFLGSTNVTSPSLSLVAFLRPLTEFHLFDRFRRGDDAAFESRMRNRKEAHFNTYDHVEYFAVPVEERDHHYVRIDGFWKGNFEPPRFLCVPTAPYMAYYSSDWLQEKDLELTELGDLIKTSESVVLSFICFLDAAKNGLKFKTKCKDARLYQADPEGGLGRLFQMPDPVSETIHEMGIPEMLAGTVYGVREAELALNAVKRVDWSIAPVDGFVFYNFAEGRLLPIPGVIWPYTITTRRLSPMAVINQEIGITTNPISKAAERQSAGVENQTSERRDNHREPHTYLRTSPAQNSERFSSRCYMQKSVSQDPHIASSTKELMDGTTQIRDAYAAQNNQPESPKSPSYEPPASAMSYITLSLEEREAFEALQEVCETSGKTVPQTILDSFRLSIIWARDSIRLAQIERQAKHLLNTVRETEVNVKQLLQTSHRTDEDFLLSGIKPPHKRIRREYDI